MDTRIPGFFRQSVERRLQIVAERLGLEPEALAAFDGDHGLGLDQADLMIENVLGRHALPLGLAVNARINGVDRFVPMVIEEPSVVAAASHGMKLLREGYPEGLRAVASRPEMIGQIQLVEVPDLDRAGEVLLGRQEELIGRANEADPTLVAAGGGAKELQVKRLEPLSADDPCGPMLVVHLVVDVRDAMGANAINRMCERISPLVEEWTQGQARLRILSNLADRRTVEVVGRVPEEELSRGGRVGRDVARRVEEASVFAERDPYRAATHNKGIMNGIDAVLVAFGQDWRAVEAGAHSLAAQDGRYTALATWRAEEGGLVGRLILPMPVGVVGGAIRVHPTARAALELAQIDSAATLAETVAAVGLAQNLSALRAMVTEGIQRGHMGLHARNLALSAGASSAEVPSVVELLREKGEYTHDAARVALRVSRES